MGRSRVNRIIEGQAKGEPMIIRGDFVRRKIWNALINSKTPLQSMELTELTKCSYEQVKHWLDAWVKFGYVKREALGKSPTGGKRFIHTAIEISQHPPAITLKGLPKPPEHRQLLWEAMRVFSDSKKQFYVADLLAYIKEFHNTDVNYDYALTYCRDLYNALYLNNKNTHSRDPLYSLKYNTGFLSPSLCRDKKVFDANLGVMVN